MTLVTGSTTPAGTFLVTVIGTSGVLSHSTTVSLTVTNPVSNSGDFQLAIAQAFPAGVAAGSQIQAKVSVTSNYAGLVNASCDASAISGQCVVTPGNPVAISASTPPSLAVTLNIPNTITPGPYTINLTVADSSGQPSHTLQLPLTVIQDFSVSSATPSQTLAVGQTITGAYQVAVAPNPVGSAFTGAVSLSCSSGLPAGAQCIFAPSAPVTLGTNSAAVVMTISTASDGVVAQLPSRYNPIFYSLWLLLPGIVVACIGVTTRLPKPRAARTSVAILFLLLLSFSLLSCGGVSAGGTSALQGNQPVIYQITVTGTSAGMTSDSGQSALVTLVVD
jgi:hypothetical protein